MSHLSCKRAATIAYIMGALSGFILGLMAEDSGESPHSAAQVGGWQRSGMVWVVKLPLGQPPP